MITRASTCSTLNLPFQIACDKCKKSIENAFETGKTATPIPSCLQPWGDKFKHHKMKQQRNKHKQVMAYLDEKRNESNQFINDVLDGKLHDTNSMKEHKNNKRETAFLSSFILPRITTNRVSNPFIINTNSNQHS